MASKVGSPNGNTNANLNTPDDDAAEDSIALSKSINDKAALIATKIEEGQAQDALIFQAAKRSQSNFKRANTLGDGFGSIT